MLVEDGIITLFVSLMQILMDNLILFLTDFYACFNNNGLNVLYNDFEWKLDPPTAGTIVENEFQTASIKITSNTGSVSASNEYTIIVNGISINPNIGEGSTIDDIWVKLYEVQLILLVRKPYCNRSYNNILNILTITADITNPPAPLYTFSRLNPTSAGNHAFLEEPDIAVSTQKMTVNWLPTFSGTVTVSVRTTGCGNPSSLPTCFH